MGSDFERVEVAFKGSLLVISMVGYLINVPVIVVIHAVRSAGKKAVGGHAGWCCGIAVFNNLNLLETAEGFLNVVVITVAVTKLFFIVIFARFRIQVKTGGGDHPGNHGDRKRQG